MRKTTLMILTTALLIGCGGSTTDTPATGEPNVNADATSQSQAAAPVEQVAVPKSEETYLEMSIADGPLKGDYKFMREDGTRGWVAVGLEDGYSNLNATKLISDDGEMKIEYLNRHIQGELATGSRPAYAVEGQCGSINLKPRTEFESHRKVRGEHLDCTNTEITVLSDWQESAPYQKRGVAGSYDDRVAFELIDGSTVESDVRVEFLAVERRRATN